MDSTSGSQPSLRPGTILPPVQPTLTTRHPHKVLGWALIVMFIILAVLAVQYIYFRPIQKSMAVKADNSISNTIAGYDSVLQVDPSNVGALLAKSVALSLQAKIESKSEYAAQAASAAEKAVTIDPKSSEAYRALGYANELQQKYAEAHTAYQRAAILNPKDNIALVSDARVYETQGDTKNAAVGYREMLKKFPSLYAARLGLARIEYIANKTPDAAMKDFKTVYTDSKNARERAEAAYGIGTILLSQNKREAAYQYMRDATTIDASYASGWLGLEITEYVPARPGVATSSASKQEVYIKSAQFLNKAITLDPNLARAHFQLASLMLVSGQNSLARATLMKAAAAVPNDRTLSIPEKEVLLKQINGLSAALTRD